MTDQKDPDKKANPEGFNPLAYLKEPRSPKTLSGTFREPRNTPKGTMLGRRDRNEAIFHIKVVKQFWWWFAPALAVTIAFFAVPFALVMLFVPYDFIVNVLGLILLLACVAGVAASYFWTRIWLPIVVQPDQIRVGSDIFDRRDTSGFAIGYSIKSDDMLKNDFQDQSMGLSGLRLRYGRWGEDIPYLVNKYHAAEIVIWANEIIDYVGAPAPKEHAPDEGRTKDIF